MLVTSWLPAAAVAAGTLGLESVRRLKLPLPFADHLSEGAERAEESANSDRSGALDSEQRTQSRLADLVNRLKQLGADLSHPIDFAIGRDGEVRVESETANRTQIEEAIAQNPDLVARFHELFGEAWQRRVNDLSKLGLSPRADDLGDLRLSIMGTQAQWRIT